MKRKSSSRESQGNTPSVLGAGIALGLALGLALSVVLGKSRKPQNDSEVKDPQQGTGQIQQPVEDDKEAIKRKHLVHLLQVSFLVVYFTALFLFLIWLLFDIWSRSFDFLRRIGVNEQALQDELLRTIGFTIIGGAMGSLLYQIRKLHLHYSKVGNFDSRWFGKYITGPWEGSALAMVFLALIRGGVSLFGGSTGIDVTATNNFASFGTGALVGFSMRDVVGWMEQMTDTLFQAKKNQKPSASAEEGGPSTQA